MMESGFDDSAMVMTRLPKWFANRSHSDPAAVQNPIVRHATVAALVLMLAAVLIVSALNAYRTPFWHDEVYTALVSELPNHDAIRRALGDAVDAQPPLYYYVARAAKLIISDDHLAYRVPSVFGFTIAVLAIYLIVSKRGDRLSGLVASALLITLPAANYAYEARPYAALLGCVCVALLAWQRVDNARGAAWALAIALAGALSMHYYAVLVWPAFVAGELTYWRLRRTFRARVWLALAAGASPLLLFRDHLAVVRDVYGQNLWAQPSARQIITAPDWLFDVGHFGFILAATVAAGICYRIASVAFDAPLPSGVRPEPDPSLVEDGVVSLGLLAVPVIAVLVAITMGGDMEPRYMLPSIIGGTVAFGLLLGTATQPVRWFLLLLLLATYGFRVPGLAGELRAGSLAAGRTAGAQAIAADIRRYHDNVVPVVVSDGLQYLPLTRYVDSDLQNHLHGLADPVAAVKYAGSDSVDRNLQILGRYTSLRIRDFAAFRSEHRRFVVLSSGGRFDYWPARLVDEGYTLTLLSDRAGARLFYAAATSPGNVP
jgi:hypothetical protein